MVGDDPVGHGHGSSAVLERVGGHELRHRQRGRAGDRRLPEPAQPAVGDVDVPALEDAQDHALGTLRGLLGRVAAQELLGRLLEPPGVRQQSRVRHADRSHVARGSFVQPGPEVLAEAHVRTEPQPVPAPGAGQQVPVQLGQRPVRVADAERGGALGADVVQHRADDEQIALWLRQPPEDLASQIAVQGVGVTTRSMPVVLRSPGLEQHAGDPPSGGLDGGLGVDGSGADLPQGRRGLVDREGEILLAQAADSRDALRGAQIDFEVDAADADHPHRRRRVPQERAYDLQRL